MIRRDSADDIKVAVLGGLGNQLFQYALGLELSRRNECPLTLLVGDLGSRELSLADLPLPPHVRFAKAPSPRKTQFMMMAGRIRAQRSFITERGFAFDPVVLEARPPATLHGYFQSWRYFESVAREVRSQIRSRQTPSEEYLRLQSELDALGPFVAVQVRRGDYLNLAEYHGVASNRYFERALDMIGDHSRPVVVFTDDDTDWTPPWMKNWNARILRPAEVRSPVENLLLMSRATRFVISNSSFGWWGAWLAGPSSERVVAPRPWFARTGNDTRDLLPLDWMTLDLRGLG